MSTLRDKDEYEYEYEYYSDYDDDGYQHNHKKTTRYTISSELYRQRMAINHSTYTPKKRKQKSQNQNYLPPKTR